MLYNEFKALFKKSHICGADVIGMATTYDSRCPRCAPDLPQWEEECKELFKQGKTTRFLGYWFEKEVLDYRDGKPVGFLKVKDIEGLNEKEN